MKRLFFTIVLFFCFQSVWGQEQNSYNVIFLEFHLKDLYFLLKIEKENISNNTAFKFELKSRDIDENKPYAFQLRHPTEKAWTAEMKKALANMLANYQITSKKDALLKDVESLPEENNESNRTIMNAYRDFQKMVFDKDIDRPVAGVLYVNRYASLTENKNNPSFKLEELKLGNELLGQAIQSKSELNMLKEIIKTEADLAGKVNTLISIVGYIITANEKILTIEEGIKKDEEDIKIQEEGRDAVLKQQFGLTEESIRSFKAARESKIKELNDALQTKKTDLANQNASLVKKTSDYNKKLMGVLESDKVKYDIRIEKVTFVVSNGFIEDMKVYAKNAKGKELIFENRYPIGFSTKRNVRGLEHTKLFASKFPAKDYYELLVADAIRYDYAIDLDTKDFSPENGTYTAFSTDVPLILYKEPKRKILELRVFSDLVGIDATNPNGIIQSEVSKRFNLYTSRKQRKWETSVGGLTFIEPYLTFSKLENDKRELTLSSYNTVNGNEVISYRYASTLDLLARQNMSVGLDLGVFDWDCPNIKTTFYLNGGFRFGKTAIIEPAFKVEQGEVTTNKEEDKQYSAVTFQAFPEIGTKFRIQKRVGFQTSYRLQYFRLLDTRFTQVARSNQQAINTDIFSNGTGHWFGTYELLGYVLYKEDSRAFFRFRFNSQMWGEGNTNFVQMQIGVTTSINVFSK